MNRRMETDEIKRFIEYAKANGSHNADKYYISISNLANKTVGIEVGTRDSISVSQLNNLILIENIIGRTIVKCIGSKMYYKDIYKKYKNRVEQFGKVAYLFLSA